MHLFRSLGCVRRLIAGLRRDRRGNYSMIVALMLPVLTGFVGMGTEAGLWFYDQQAQQSVADAAAFSAATYYKGQEPNPGASAASGAQSQALAIAASFGYGGTTNSCAVANGVNSCTQPSGCSETAPGVGSVCVTVNSPPAAGANAGNPLAFEVLVSQSPQQLFSKLLLPNPVVITARTVGVVQAVPGQGCANGANNACVCVKVLGAATFSGSANLSLNSCSFEDDDASASGVTLSGSAKISGSDIYVTPSGASAPTYTSSGTSCTASNQSTSPCNVVTGTVTAPPSGGYSDPYAAQDASAIPTLSSSTAGGCASGSAKTASGSSATPGYFTTFRVSSSITLSAGTYFICPSGTFTVSGSATVSTAPFPLASGCTSPYVSCNGSVPFQSGQGVTIVLLGVTSGGTVSSCASVSISGSATLELVPPGPSSGAFAGILFAETPGCKPASSTATFSGSASTDIFGAIDLPGYAVTYSGSSTAGASGCLSLVAGTLTMSGSAAFANSCSGVGTAGIGPSGTTYTASLGS